MKTRDLIKILQEEDPEGDKEVIVNGHDIYYAEALPGYYDGVYTRLIRNPTVEGWNIIGCEIQGVLDKVELITLSYKELIDNDPTIPVVFITGEVNEKHHILKVATYRAKAIELYNSGNFWREDRQKEKALQILKEEAPNNWEELLKMAEAKRLHEERR